MAGVNRKVMVPGEPLQVSQVLEDITKNTVFYIAHRERVILLFLSRSSPPSAWSMTFDEATKFSADVREAYQAITDDAKIALLEKEFDGERD